tara:strand:+ start:527 stop:1489 length:963 start_codon:yes stop_codon:yes gene_type:complete
MIKDRYLIVDGYNLFTRHYVAHPAMAENGEQVGGIVGFFNNLARQIMKCRPERVFILWEGGGSKRKRDLYPEYKRGGRPQKLNRYYDDIPDTLKNRNYQIKSLIKLLSFVPVQQIYVEDAEADDAIGYMCQNVFRDKYKIILSSDHDFYQLINEKTIIWSPTLKAFVNDQKVIDRFQVNPHNFCLAKCIVGDNSDNIPGIKGVGYKMLSKGLTELNSEIEVSISDVIDSCKEHVKVSKKKMYQNIIDNEDLIRRNWKLVHLDLNNLNHFQVQKIKNSIENNEVVWKNIDANRFLIKLGIKNIDLLACNQTFKILRKQNNG